MAHAIKGGKCKVWEKWPSGQSKAGGSEYLELHGAFSIALRAPGAALLSRFGFLAGRGTREIAFAMVLVGVVLRGGSGGEKLAPLVRELPRTHDLSLLLTVGRCGEVGLPAEVGGEGPKGGDREGFLPAQTPSGSTGAIDRTIR